MKSKTADKCPRTAVISHKWEAGLLFAYELAHCKNFPAMLVGCRIVVPKEKLLAWIEAKVAMNELCG